MKRTVVLWTVAIVGLGVGGRAGAQNIEILPPEAPPARRPPAPSPDEPPEVTPATPPEATPPEATPPEATPPEAPAAAPTETPAAAATGAGGAAFGEAWHCAISLERALGYDHISQTQSSYGQDARTTATNFTLFGAPNTGALAAFSFPRAAFDLFVAPAFSVGIGVGLLYGSTTATPSGGNSTQQSFTGLLAAPRVGYALNLAPDITLWARGGVSVVYARVNPSGPYTTGPTSSHLVAATIELPVVFTVSPRLALTAGPTLDITFSGHLTRPGFGYGGSASYDERVTEIGIQGGVLVQL